MKSAGVDINKGPGQVVGIPTRYWLDGLGIKPQWVQDFPHPSRLTSTPTHLLYISYPVSFLGVKQPGHGIHHPPSSRAKLKERIKLTIPLLPLQALIVCYRENISIKTTLNTCQPVYYFNKNPF